MQIGDVDPRCETPTNHPTLTPQQAVTRTWTPDPESWARVHLARLPLREAPLTAEVAFASRRLRVGSTDPADRFLAATALVYDLTLVTADARLREIDGVDVLPNT